MGWIEKIIRKEAPLKISRFVELALYHPVHGYYSRTVTGKDGDFYTAPDLHPIFGEAIGDYLQERGAGVVLEAGAGKGWLAHDILQVYDGEYWIVERSEHMKKIEFEVLKPFKNRVKWFHDIKSVPAFDGVFLSNELFDAFPFDLYRRTEKGWQEVLVDENFRFVYRDADESVRSILLEYGDVEFLVLPRGWDEFVRELSKRHTGEFIVIDYGFERNELVKKFPWGTIQTYRKHRPGKSFLKDPGEQDITFFIDFTLLKETFEKYGYRDVRLKTQADFLVEDIKILNRLVEMEKTCDTKSVVKARLAVKTLLVDFGRSFKVLRGRK